MWPIIAGVGPVLGSGTLVPVQQSGGAMVLCGWSDGSGDKDEGQVLQLQSVR